MPDRGRLQSDFLAGVRHGIALHRNGLRALEGYRGIAKSFHLAFDEKRRGPTVATARPSFSAASLKDGAEALSLRNMTCSIVVIGCPASGMGTRQLLGVTLRATRKPHRGRDFFTNDARLQSGKID